MESSANIPSNIFYKNRENFSSNNITSENLGSPREVSMKFDRSLQNLSRPKELDDAVKKIAKLEAQMITKDEYIEALSQDLELNKQIFKEELTKKAELIQTLGSELSEVKLQLQEASNSERVHNAHEQGIQMLQHENEKKQRDIDQMATLVKTLNQKIDEISLSKSEDETKMQALQLANENLQQQSQA